MAASILQSSVLRLTLLTAAFIGLAATAIMAVVAYAGLSDLAERTEVALRADTTRLSRVFSEGGMSRLEAAVEEASRSGTGLYFLGDERRQRKAGNLPEAPSLAKGTRTGTFSYKPDAASAPRVAAGVVVDAGSGMALVIGRDIEEQRRLLVTLLRGGAIGLVCLGAFGLLAGLHLARRIESRIDGMSAASRSIMAGDLSQRIPRQGTGDELDRLAGQLNVMLERIERLMTGMREVSDNIAHDLKTPLNRLRNRAETALADARGGPAWREGLEATLESADDLIKTFNALLLIARLEAGAGDEATDIVDAKEIATDVAELYAPAAEEAGFVIDLRATTSAPIRANRQLIAQALANLVDNAIKYSAAASGGQSAAGRDRIAISVETAGNEVLMSVADRGPGIATGDRERALQRFGRLEASRTRPGSGLGLSLVAAVMRMHGGAVRLEDNAPGLRVVLAVPLCETTATGAPA